MISVLVVCAVLLIAVDPVRVLFTVNPNDEDGHDAGYYRSNFARKMHRKGGVVGHLAGAGIQLMPDPLVHYVRHRVPQVRMGEITGIKPTYQPRLPLVSGYDPESPAEAELEIRAIPEAPDELMLNKGKSSAKVLRAIEEAQLPLCGLGGFTSICTEGGELIKMQANHMDCALTTGNGLTTYDSVETLLQLAYFACIDVREATLAITGGRGSIGLACAKILAPMVKHVALIGRPDPESEIHGQQAMRKIGTENLEWTTDLAYGMSLANLFIGAAGGEKSLIVPADAVNDGLVGVDTSRPRHGIPGKESVCVVAGGVKKLPGQIHQTFNFGLGEGECYACMGETITMGLEPTLTKTNRSLGKELNIQDVLKIGELARKHGITSARLRKVDDMPMDDEILLDFLGHRTMILPEQRRDWVTRFYRRMHEGLDIRALLATVAA